jgi:hypothetical protein
VLSVRERRRLAAAVYGARIAGWAGWSEVRSPATEPPEKFGWLKEIKYFAAKLYLEPFVKIPSIAVRTVPNGK